MDVLIIEENAQDAEYLETTLVDVGRLKPTVKANVVDAVAELSAHEFGAILLSIDHADVSNSRQVQAIRQVNSEVPIVALLENSSVDGACRLLENGRSHNGIQDYLLKSECSAHTIARSIRYAVERKLSETQLNHLTRYDVLTDIPNRQYLQEQLDRAIKKARRTAKKVGLYFLDIDRFKAVNDTLGHGAGDQLLRNVVQRLRENIRSGDLLARIGGDEFAVMVEDIGESWEFEAIARNLLSVFDKIFEFHDTSLDLTVSMGIAAFPSDRDDAAGLLNAADTAMYQAKDDSQNSYKFFTQEMQDAALNYHRIAGDLRRALDDDQFRLVYQPQISLRDGQVHALEALLRWKHPERGMMPPNEFIGVAEETGHIVPIGKWVLESVCRQINEWAETGLPTPRVSVNIAPLHFHQPNFVRQVCAIVEKYQIHPSQIELELTERTLMDDTYAMRTCLNDLREYGFRIAIDDFGTGYSCLSYLSRFPLDVLKIDRSFVSDLGAHPDGMAICGVIVSIAKQLNLACVAEGIELQMHVDILRSLGCEFGQGYLFSRPVDPRQIEEHILSISIDQHQTNKAIIEEAAPQSA